MSPGRFIKSEFEGVEMQHRYEDRALIEEVLVTRRPRVAVEYGTAAGGFASFLAATLAAWDGRVVSIDKVPCPNREVLLQRHPNLDLYTLDLLSLASWPTWLMEAVSGPDTLVYTDNGNKEQEIYITAPLLLSGSTLGTHDYWTEVKPEWVEPYLAGLGYTPHRHADFEALSDPVNYPVSLTRFWVRGER